MAYSLKEGCYIQLSGCVYKCFFAAALTVHFSDLIKVGEDGGQLS